MPPDTPDKENVVREEIVLSPLQRNRVMLEKLALLVPRFESLRDELLGYHNELSNGMIHWSDIMERAKRMC